MRVLIVTNLYPNPAQPNRATFNRQQFSALADRHDVAVIAPIAWTDELSFRRSGKTRIPDGRRVEGEGIMAIHPIYWFPPKIMRGAYGRFYRRAIARTFKRMIAEFRPEVVLGSWAYPDGWAAVSLGHEYGLPVVVKVHGSDVLLMDQFPARKRKTLHALREADGVIAVSRDLARVVTAAGVEPEKVHVVYNGVDTGVFFPGSKSAARARLKLEQAEALILFIGNLVAVKGIDVLIDACASLKRQGVALQCCIIGEGPLRSALEGQIQRLGLSKQVVLSGSKPHRELPDWFRAADVFALPSHSEGVANVLLEASACGTPFVATRVGGIPEIAEQYDGKLVPPGDPEALATSLKERLLEAAPDKTEAPGGAMRSHADAADEVAAALKRAIETFSGRRAASNGASATARFGARSLIRQTLKAALAAVLPRRLLVVRGPQRAGAVYLTFDDGPHPQHTPRLLDVLREHGVRATFFLIGKNVERHSEVVKRIAAEGHEIGHHTFNHSDPRALSAGQLIGEIDRTNELFSAIIGKRSGIFRPPWGKVTAYKLMRLWGRGQRVVLWNADPRDCDCQSSDEVREWFRRNPTSAGDIVLMHDDHPYAADVLPEVIQAARTRGLRFGTPVDGARA